MPRSQLTRSTAIRLVLVAPIALVFGTGAASQQPRHGRRSQPVPTSRAAPDTTGTIAAPKVVKPTVPPLAADDETLPAPFNLPVAPRARVRACGESWQARKLAGQAGDDTWREYATKCLADNEGAKAAATGTSISAPRDGDAVGHDANQRKAGP